MRKIGKNIVLAGALALFALTACKKDEIQFPESNDPVFLMNGEFGGESFELIAGDNNVYMHTMTELENGVRVFSGKLANDQFSVELGVYDGMIDIPNHLPIEEMDNFVPTFSARSLEPLLELDKTQLGCGLIESVQWFINGTLAGHNYVQIREPGNYDICALITYQDQSMAQLCDQVIVGYQRNANFSISFDAQQGVVNASIVNAGGVGVESVKWFLEGDEISSASQLQYNMGGDLKKLSAQVKFENGVERTKTVLVDGSYGDKSINDFSVFEVLTSVMPPRDFNVRLRVRNGSFEYDSELTQNADSQLEISNIEYYGVNDQGNHVYKIQANVSAIVAEVGNSKKIPINFSTVFGVEVP